MRFRAGFKPAARHTISRIALTIDRMPDRQQVKHATIFGQLQHCGNLLVLKGSHWHARKIKGNGLQKNILPDVPGLDEAVPLGSTAVFSGRTFHHRCDHHDHRRLADGLLVERRSLQCWTQIARQMLLQSVTFRLVVTDTVRSDDIQLDRIQRPGRRRSPKSAPRFCNSLTGPAKLQDLLADQWPITPRQAQL